MTVSFERIAVGSQWSRNQLAELWGYRAFQALARGVVTPARDNKIILFATEDQQATATQYRDVLFDDTLQWEGPNDHFAEARMLQAADSGDEIHLFHRRQHHADFMYRGQLAVRSFEPHTERPSHFVFDVLDPDRQDWTHDQVLAALFLYLRLKPNELRDEGSEVSRFAAAIRKSPRAVAARLRALGQLDPTIADSSLSPSANTTATDEMVVRELDSDWTATVIRAADSFESLVGSRDTVDPDEPASASDARFMFQVGRTREAIVQVRRDQHIFRRAVLNGYGAKCCVCGLDDERLLIASHIVPWADDAKNRLNPENGLCLSALHDRAFDRGLMTILPDYTVRVRKDLKDRGSDSFLFESVVRFDGSKIALPSRRAPNPEFLSSHAKRFGFL